MIITILWRLRSKNASNSIEVCKLNNSNSDKEQPLGVTMIPVDKLHPGKYQARISYPEEKLKQLAASIEKDGVIQPIVVCPSREGYEVCAGWGRVLACRSLGRKEIPAIVRNLSEPEKAKLGVMENIQRQDLNVVETARAYQILGETCKMTQEEVASAVGVTRDVVAQTLRILTFPKDLQNLLVQGIVTQSHGEALARLANIPEQLKEAIAEVVSKNLTSTQTEQIVAWILERTKLREDISEFASSEEFLMTLGYFQFMPSLEKKFNICPSCLDQGKSLYIVANMHHIMTWGCSVCGWRSYNADAPLIRLLDRTRALLLKKKALNNSLTKTSEAEKLIGQTPN